MIKRELKANLKSFIIWTSILIGLFVVVLITYPLVFTDENMGVLDEMMAMMPEELLKAFNMDISSISTEYGWLKSEGILMIIMIVGIFGGILGSTICLKEENDNTIEYLAMLPITRRKIIIDKVIVSIIYITLMVVISGLFNLVGLLISGEFNISEYLMIAVSPLFVALPLFSINLLISMFLKNTKKSLLLAIGITFVSYFFLIMGEIDDATTFFKYFSVFSFADTRNIILEGSMNILLILGSLILSSVLIVLSILKYEKKELI